MTMLPYLFKLGGAALLLGLLAQIALWLASSFRRLVAARTQRQLELEILRERLALARLQRKKKEQSALPWSGTRKFRVERRVMECDGVCSFHLAAHDKKPLPAFLPGQYLTFELDIPGQSRRVVRCYSLSDRAQTGHYRVTIKRIPPPPDRPQLGPGLVSDFFHSRVREGDILDAKAPAGGFFLDLSHEGPVVLIGGGVGVTPLMSMLNEIVTSGSKRETWFIFGVRSKQDHVFKADLEEAARACENVHLCVCYSRPEPSDVLELDFHRAGHISIGLLKELLPSNNYDFYVCGPGPMMENIVRSLREWGVPERNIHTEAFGPASVKKAVPPAAALPGAASLSVTFAKSAKTQAWAGKTDSLLDFAEAHGVAIDCGCRAGNCGTCKTAIRSGKVTYLKEPGCEVENGSCLTCICVPETELVLEA